MPAHRLNVLHAIHDFLPRHEAGSEIYAFELCRELATRHHVSLLAAEYDPARPHGHVTWRVYERLPVIELVNNWQGDSFEDTYRNPRIGEQLAHVLDAVQPDIVHVHNLLNLSFDVPALARARGIPVVATLHDYTLVCPSGGQRLHRAEQHVCHQIDTARCTRCFRESPFFSQMAFSKVTAAVGAPRAMHRLASAVLKRVPAVARRVAGAVRHASVVPLTEQDIAGRLAAARRLFDDIDLFVSPSSSMAAEFQRLGLDASKIRVSDYGFAPLRPSGSGPTTERPARQANTPLRIGYVGTLVWHKGVHVLLDAVRMLPDTRYQLTIFGSPDVFPDYAATLHRKASGLPVRFLGAFGRDRTADVYAQIDVLVVPSLWLENSPLVIHEAFMAGVPVVGARIGGIVDLVADGRNGLLYDPTSPSDLAAALGQLIERPDRLAAFRAMLPAVKPIAEDAREWERVYREVIDRRAGRTA